MIKTIEIKNFQVTPCLSNLQKGSYRLAPFLLVIRWRFLLDLHSFRKTSFKFVFLDFTSAPTSAPTPWSRPPSQTWSAPPTSVPIGGEQRDIIHIKGQLQLVCWGTGITGTLYFSKAQFCYKSKTVLKIKSLRGQRKCFNEHWFKFKAKLKNLCETSHASNRKMTRHHSYNFSKKTGC